MSFHTAGGSSFTPKQIDTLAAGDLYSGNLVFVDCVRDAAQFVSSCLRRPHARNHAEGAILLDVGVRSLVDEARLRIVQRLFGHVEIR